MNQLTKILALGAALSLPAISAADILVLKDGTELKGRIENISNADQRISFTSGTGRLELPRARIDRIIEESDAQDYTHLGNQFLEMKNHSFAVKMYQQALAADSTFEPARKGLDEAQAVIAEQQQERVRDAQNAITQQLEQISDTLANESFDEARYKELEKNLNAMMVSADASEQQMVSAQRLLRDLYLKWGFARFDRMDRSGAEEMYMRVREMDPDNKEAQEKLLEIWKNVPDKKPEVLKVYQKRLQEEPNNLELNKTVGDLLYDLRRYSEAIEPLKIVAASPRYQNQGYDQRLQNSYTYAIDGLEGEGKLSAAANLMKDMLSLNLSQNRARLQRLNYMIELDQLPKDSEDYWNMRARLARNSLTEPGLQSMRERELELVLKSDPDNEVALEAFREISQSQLAEINEALRVGDFIPARDMAADFIQSEGRFPELVEQARELYNKADIGAREQERQAAETAKQLAQNGDSYFQKANQAESMMISQERLRQEANQSGSSRSYNYGSYKNEAILNAQRAIERYEAAIKLDPSLGEPTGMDLNAKISEMRTLVNRLEEPARRLPRATRR